MFECKVNEIMNWFHTGYKDEIHKTHTVVADTKENMFKKVYSFERSARYDNARRYEITDKNLYDEYRNWKVNGVTIDMYYGSSGYVD